MAEGEEVLTDLARHATVFARDLWRRHRPSTDKPQTIRLTDVARRLDLLVGAIFGEGYPLRVAQSPAPPTLLSRIFHRRRGPPRCHAVPATDGVSLWLPDDCGLLHAARAAERFRIAAIQQAMRARRGSAQTAARASGPLAREVYLLLEAHAADQTLARLFPGAAERLESFRREALASRPSVTAFPPPLDALERLARELMAAPIDGPVATEPSGSLEQAEQLAARLMPEGAARRLGPHPLWKDWWTGELRPPASGSSQTSASGVSADLQAAAQSPRTAQLSRRPRVREAGEDEDDRGPGAWMVQTSQPHEIAEDPHGLQRPTDRDAETAAEDFAQSLEELAEARLVSTPGRVREVLLSDDPPETHARGQTPGAATGERTVRYPEWDFCTGAYRDPGATVHLLPAAQGSQAWVDRILAERRTMLDAIRRRFELLRAERVRLRRQLDGEELDLAAWVDGCADLRAGLPMEQALYQTHRPSRRSLAVLLLVDVSGSTDAWLSGGRRVIDVEREALLLVCVALESLGEPYAVEAFSGEGPHGVTVRSVKRFEERYRTEVARRIAALEPEQYTRAGAAIRHATALLMRQPARHRLLVMLSDGRPNDADEYDGRYGVEDFRQAVVEAKLQGISPFCLTIDRQAAGYMPRVFGAHHYALLQKPERLPTVLLEWLKRLVAA